MPDSPSVAVWGMQGTLVLALILVLGQPMPAHSRQGAGNARGQVPATPWIAERPGSLPGVGPTGPDG